MRAVLEAIATFLAKGSSMQTQARGRLSGFLGQQLLCSLYPVLHNAARVLSDVRLFPGPNSIWEKLQVCGYRSPASP